MMSPDSEPAQGTSYAPAAFDSGGRKGRRLPLPLAFFLTWFRPREVAIRTNHVGVGRVIASLFVTAVVTCAIIVGLVAVSELWMGRWLSSFVSLFLEVIDEFRHFDWYIKGLIVLSPLGALLGVAVLASLFAPWGAQYEPWTRSFGHAFRRTLIAFSIAIPLTVVAGSVVVFVDHEWFEWNQSSYEDLGPQPRQPANAAANSPEMQEYQRLQLEWRERFSARWATRPWYLQNADAVLALVCMICGLVICTSLLCAIGAPRPVHAVRHAPRCAHCGYDLTGSAVDSRCPECGLACAVSFGPTSRQGTQWERSVAGSRSSLVRAWWRFARTAAANSEQLGYSLRTTHSSNAHRRFLAITAAAGAIVGVVAPPLLYVAESNRNPFTSDPVESVLYMLGGAIIVGFGIVVFVQLCTHWLLGVYFRTTDRYLLATAFQATCYHSPALITLVLALTMAAIPVFALEGELRTFSRPRGLDHEAIMATFVAFVGGVFLARFLRRAAKTLRAARFANA